MPSDMPAAGMCMLWHMLTAAVSRYALIAHERFVLVAAECTLRVPSMPDASIMSQALTLAILRHARIAHARSVLAAAERTLVMSNHAQHACGCCAHMLACIDGGRLALRSHCARTVHAALGSL